MLLWINFIAVVLIWATTPLAIKLTAEAISPVASLTYRILGAVLLGCVVSVVIDGKALAVRRNYRLYFAASLGIFPNMLVVYIASQSISSGLVALLFATSPFFAMALEKPILGYSSFRARHWLSGMIALMGLAVILYAPSGVNSNLWVGVPLMMLSNIFFSVSGLWVKKINQEQEVSPLQQCLGAMIFALPGLIITMLVSGTPTALPQSVNTLLMLLYLVVMGSLVGFMAYFTLLKNLSMNGIAVLPFLSPALALIIGVTFANEAIGSQIFIGSMIILFALALYQNLFKIAFNYCFNRKHT